MPPTVAQIEHQLPGRVRLRVAAQRGNVTELGEQIAAAPGVRTVRTNPRTGSILIEHTGDLDTIIRFAEEHRLLEFAPRERRWTPSLRSEKRKGPGVPHPLSLTAAGLGSLAIYQLARGNVLGSATEILWQSYSAYKILGRPWLSSAYAGLGLFQLVRGRILGPASSLLFYAMTAHRMRPGGGIISDL